MNQDSGVRLARRSAETSALPQARQVAKTLAAGQDVRKRLRACNPEALTPVETLTVLLGEKSLERAVALRAGFGSLAALARAAPAPLASSACALSGQKRT